MVLFRIPDMALLSYNRVQYDLRRIFLCNMIYFDYFCLNVSECNVGE